MKNFFNDEVYEMPDGKQVKIINKILTTEDTEYVPLCVQDAQGIISIMFGRKINY